MKKTPEKLLAEKAQEAEQKRHVLLQRGDVRLDPSSEVKVDDARLRLLQTELEYQRIAAR